MSGVEATSSNGHVVGRYVLYDEIAAGGMATIHIGRMLGEVGFTRPVAIKRLHPQYARDSEFVQMFLEEARLAARIRHPNVVPVLDIVSTDHELFLVMEFIQGETVTRLTRVSRSKARIIPLNIALAIAADMLQGLHAAHEAKDELGKPLDIVHRDISPHNVMVGHDGVARVLDFGIAKASSSAQSTRDGEVKGKFAYMSPEQLSSVPVDRRADVFAASIVLWEMLTGERLFQAPDPAAIVGKVLHGVLKKPSQCVGGLPPALDALVMKGLERDVSKRFSSAAEMARAIETMGLPIARPTEVGQWVNRIAGDALKKRAKRLAEIESTGSFSRENVLAATAAMSQRDITGSGSQRSGMRPISEPSMPPHASAPLAPTSMPHALPSMPHAASSSQQLALHDVVEPRRRSRAGVVSVAFFALLLGGAGVFVWRAGGARPARDKVMAYFHVEPHGTPMGHASPAASVAALATAASSDAPSTLAENGPIAIDITAATNAATPSTRLRGQTNARNAARTSPGPTGGASSEIAPSTNVTAEQARAPSGSVSQHPSQGQVQAALGAMMGSAKACFNPDDPPTRALVTFQSDGTVKSVGVTGFAAGKPQEACVKGMFAKARVDPFSDATYSLPISIRP